MDAGLEPERWLAARRHVNKAATLLAALRHSWLLEPGARPHLHAVEAIRGELVEVAARLSVDPWRQAEVLRLIGDKLAGVSDAAAAEVRAAWAEIAEIK